ncbi:MAG: hypothetical protein JST73_05460 [Actinobacteria bacterium]|nr:hypothetical protein [Actinomycetota bacterium]
MTRVASSPALFRLERFVSTYEASTIIALGAEVEREPRDLVTKHDSTGFSVELLTDTNPVVAQVQRRIAALIGMPWHTERSLRFRRYRSGEGHPPTSTTTASPTSTCSSPRWSCYAQPRPAAGRRSRTPDHPTAG